MILAHRGDTQNYCSSTKESVLSALEKCDGVELDLNISKDGVFYFYHEGDWTIPVLAREHAFSSLWQFIWNGESALSLLEGLRLAKQADKHLLIHAEIGGGGVPRARDFSSEELQQVLGIVRTSGIDRSLVLFHTTKPAKAIGFRIHGHNVFHRNPVVFKRRYGMYRFGELMAILPHLDANTTMAYVINDEREFQRLMDWGIGYVLTDKLF